MKLKLFFVVLTASAFIYSCSSEEESDQMIVGDEVVVEEINSSAYGTDGETRQIWSFSPPSEIFTLVSDLNGTPSPELMNTTDNVEKYVTIEKQALNFGVYSTDLAYTSNFEMGVDAIKQFNNLKKMADKLEISGAFDEETLERIKKNLTSSDSLLSIADEIYFNVYLYQEEEERGHVLAQIVVGAWIESLNLVTNLAGDYNPENIGIQRIAEQKLIMENLLDYLNHYKYDDTVASLINSLKPLSEMFASLEEKEIEVTNEGVNENGATVIGGGSKILITEEQYESIVEEVAKLRASFVSVE